MDSDPRKLGEQLGGAAPQPERSSTISSAETAPGQASFTSGSSGSISAFAAGDALSGRFRIIRMMGRGGMGEVYEAQDLDLGERVALKTIRPELCSGERGLARFKKEVQLARRVTHPNVCRIFDLARHQSQPNHPDRPCVDVTFLTMEMLEGETLSERLARAGKMSTADATPIVEQMASALAAAHTVGIVHRDFKPGNVMLVRPGSGIGTERAVVTDFGLARTVSLSGAIEDSQLQTSLTESGQLVGTVAYMAPEQLRGGEVTPATDVYALGLVMFEMVNGKRPVFPLAPLAGLDPKWQAAISRCLEMDPAKRFAGPMDVIAALKSKTELGSGAGGIREGSISEHASASEPGPPNALRATQVQWFGLALVAIAVAAILVIAPWKRALPPSPPVASAPPTVQQLAVLPFDTVGGDSTLRAFANGLTDTLTGKLTQLTGKRSLVIFPASEVRAHDITTVEAAQKEFGVNQVLMGSLQSDGKQVRVTAVLIDAKTRRQVDSETVTALLADSFAVEDQVVSRSVHMLGIEPSEKERQTLEAHGTQQAAAYDDYLEGLGYVRQFAKAENLQKATLAFNRALEKDNKYGLAYAGLGEVYWHKYEHTHDASWVVLARAACQKSASLENAGAQAHVCLGLLDNGTGHYAEATEQFKRVLDLEPTNDQGYEGLAESYQKLGKFDEAEKAYHAAIALRPNYGAAYSWLGAFYYSRGRFADAARMFQAGVNLSPDSFVMQSNLGGADLLEGKYSEAIDPLKTSIAIRPTYGALSNLGTAYFDVHRYAEAARTYEQACKVDTQSYEVWGNLGDAYYWAPGERGHAATAYQKAVELAKKDLEVNPKDAPRISYVANYEAMLGDRAQAMLFLDRAIHLAGKDPEIMFNAALVRNQLGDKDQAIDWLTKAVNAGYPISALRDTPNFSNLQRDGRFQNLLKRQ